MSRVMTDLGYRLDRDGFLRLDRPIIGALELSELRGLLDGVYERFAALPSSAARDLGDVKVHAGAPQIAELMNVCVLEPRLPASAAYRVVRDLAAELLGGSVVALSDHAISKPPGNQKATAWHQDLAYARVPIRGEAIHIWLPLQDATTCNGCMEFIPGSHRTGLRPHHRLNHDARAHALTTDDVDARAAVACPLPAGGVTVHTSRTLHFTGPNLSTATRAAWITSWCRADGD